jgi:predicted kinase
MLQSTFHSESEAQQERLWRESLWDLAKGAYTRPEEAVARAYSLVRAEHGSLTLLVGPSGSGKSTWIAEHAGASEVISLDQMREEITGDASDQHENTRVLHQSRDRLKEALRKRRDVIWDATSLRRDSRSMLFQMARDYGAHTTQVVFCTPMNEIFRRNRQREKSIPTSALKRQFSTLEWPDIHEAHRTLFVDADTRIAHDSRTIWKQIS